MIGMLVGLRCVHGTRSFARVACCHSPMHTQTQSHTQQSAPESEFVRRLRATIQARLDQLAPRIAEFEAELAELHVRLDEARADQAAQQS
jgi:hypothetical protein